MTPNEQEGKNTTRSSFQPPEKMEATEDRALWELLGRARRPAAPSPYFTRRVLREVAFREEEETAERSRNGDGGWWRRFLPAMATGGWRPRFAAAAAGVVVIGLFAVGLLRLSSLENGTGGAPFAQTSGAPGDGDELLLIPESISDRDLAVIADLDDLLDTQENRAWLEDDSAS